MKTKKEIKEEIPYADVMTTKMFLECVKCRGFIEYDGYGYFHDGEKETDVSCWSNLDKAANYPYVCWYNK